MKLAVGLLALVIAAPVLAAQPKAKPQSAAAAAAKPLTCTSPVLPGDSAASLKRRFGKAATMATLPGPEGQDYRALVLWAREPQRRLEVSFWDAAMTKVSDVALGQSARGWSIAGVRLGDPIAHVEAANGGPFQLGGFEWDYGGYLQDAKGGKLTILPGGCRVSVRLGLGGQGSADNAILGDVTLQSNNSAVRKAQPRVTRLSIGWPGAD